MKRIVLGERLGGSVRGQQRHRPKRWHPSRPARLRHRRTIRAPVTRRRSRSPVGTEASPSAPEGQVALGAVHIPKSVKADGKTLAAGTYQVRLTPQTASPDAKGQTATLERWVEFTKGGKVAGREVVTIIPNSEISKVQKDTPPGGQLREGRDA